MRTSTVDALLCYKAGFSRRSFTQKTRLLKDNCDCVYLLITRCLRRRCSEYYLAPPVKRSRAIQSGLLSVCCDTSPLFIHKSVILALPQKTALIISPTSPSALTYHRFVQLLKFTPDSNTACYTEWWLVHESWTGSKHFVYQSFCCFRLTVAFHQW